MRRIFIYAWLLVGLAACNGSEQPSVEDGLIFPEHDGGLAILAPIDSGNDDVTLQDITGIQILRKDGVTVDYTQAPIAGVGELKANQTKMTITPKQYFDAYRTKANFLAYYPAGTPAANKVSYTITGQEDIIASQPISAEYGTNSTSNPMVFLFEHKLALIELYVVATAQGVYDTFGALNEATLSVPNQLEMTINSAGGVVLAKKSPTIAVLNFTGVQMYVKGGTVKKGTAMIYPDKNDLVKIRLGFANYPAKDYNVSFSNLEAGKRYKITANVDADQIKFKVTVKEWLPGVAGGDLNLGEPEEEN